MKIFKDIFTGDELCSDSFPMELVDDIVYEFKGKEVVQMEKEVILAGSNPSEVEVEEKPEVVVSKGVDVVLDYRLQKMPTPFEDGKQFEDWAAGYQKKLVDHMKKNDVSEAEIAKFENKLQNFVESLTVKDRFENLEFFMGSGENALNGQLAILEHRDVDGKEIPTLMLLKAGIEEEKE